MLTFLALSFSLVSCVLLDNQDKWDGSVATSFADGDGDESSPYLISSLSARRTQMNDVAPLVQMKFSLRSK